MQGPWLEDAGRRLQYPTTNFSTWACLHQPQTRLVLVFWSTALQTVYIIELAVSWENYVEEAYEHKKLHYAGLAAEVKQHGTQKSIQLKWDAEDLLRHQTTKRTRNPRLGSAEYHQISLRGSWE